MAEPAAVSVPAIVSFQAVETAPKKPKRSHHVAVERCSKGHERTEANTYRISGQLRCRACAEERGAIERRSLRLDEATMPAPSERLIQSALKYLAAVQRSFTSKGKRDTGVHVAGRRGRSCSILVSRGHAELLHYNGRPAFRITPEGRAALGLAPDG